MIMGRGKWGEMYDEAMAITGYEYQTLNAMAYTARRIEFMRRRINLSWSHHREVAPLEPHYINRMNAMREHIARELKVELEPMNDVGRPEDNNGMTQTITGESKHKSTNILRRLKRDELAWTASKLYCETSAILGAMWGMDESRRIRGQNESSENFQMTTSWRDYGFTSPRDAVTCERVGEQCRV